REIQTLDSQNVSNDVVAGPAATARSRPQLGRHACRRRIELGPRRAQEPHLPFEYRRVEGLAVERRGREGDAPEVGRTGARVAVDDLDRRLRRERRIEASALRDREIPGQVAAELLDRLVLSLATALEARPVSGNGDPALGPGWFFDDHAKLHSSTSNPREAASKLGVDPP